MIFFMYFPFAAVLMVFHVMRTFNFMIVLREFFYLLGC